MDEFTRPMTEEEELEAARLKRIAERAELDAAARRVNLDNDPDTEAASEVPKAKFLSKKDRERLALERLAKKRGRAPESPPVSSSASSRREVDANGSRDHTGEELKLIKEHYLGRKAKKRHILKPSEKFSRIFAFDWEKDDDTTEALNEIYKNKLPMNPLFGRGSLAGIDPRSQRKASNFTAALMDRRQQEGLAGSYDLRRAGEDEAEEVREKNTHWSEKRLEDMTQRDWRIFREDFDIRVRGNGKAPMPLRFWREANGLPDELHRAIEELGFKHPSPVQRQAIPAGLMFKDIMGIAETGSGKTAAFALPMLAYILSSPVHKRGSTAENGPLALVMAPTRELAQQIHAEAVKLSKFTSIRSCCVVGGQSVEVQGFELRQGVDFVVGTPGRIQDCLESRYMVLHQCNYVVLDEADRMIDMGFEPQVQAILDAMSDNSTRDNNEENRVTCFFSATMPRAVVRLSQQYLRDPITVQIGDEDTGKNKRIEQRIEWTSEGAKTRRIIQLLKELGREEKVIVFVNIKKNCDMVARQLERSGLENIFVLHGGKSQDQREYALERFKNEDNDKARILVATDVAGRGLDIPDVSHVFNYDMPSSIEAYTHRIGRTGRAGKTGRATTFLTEHDQEVMNDLKEYLQSTGSRVPNELARRCRQSAPELL